MELHDNRPENLENTPPFAAFIPPSIHRDDLLAGNSYSHHTPVPSLLRPENPSNDALGTEPVSRECVLGVDEAGRGPVLGPMIYGVFYLPSELQHSLLAAAHHFDDSKVLTPSVRANLMKTVCTEGSDLYQSCGWAIKSLSARDIGAGMLRNGGSFNLNAQAMEATIEIIKGVIAQGVNIREVYVDTIGNPDAYQKKLERIFPTVQIRVEKKADSLFPCVSAASVIAKVTRDVSCELLYLDFAQQHQGDGHLEEGAEWGSGYPSDAKCVGWLKSKINPLFGFGSECRFSWGTVKEMMEEKGNVKVDWPATADETNMQLSEYFTARGIGGENASNSDSFHTWFGSRVREEAF